MSDQYENLTLEEEELDLGILSHFKTDDPKQVFLRLQGMGDKKRQIIFEELDNIENLILSEQKKIIRALIGNNIPKWPQERWNIIRIIAEAIDEYQGDSIKIVADLNLATGRNFSIFKGNVDWPKFADRSQKLLHSLEVFYEVKAYPQIVMALLYLQSFYNTITDKAKLDSIFDQLSDALSKLKIYSNRGEFNQEDFLKELLPEFYPPTPLALEIKKTFSSFGFLPEMQINRLCEPLNTEERNLTLYACWQALTALRNRWQQQGQKPAYDERLKDEVREEVKFTSKLTDFISWEADRRLSLEKKQGT